MLRCRPVLLSLGLVGIIIFIQLSTNKKEIHPEMIQEQTSLEISKEPTNPEIIQEQTNPEISKEQTDPEIIRKQKYQEISKEIKAERLVQRQFLRKQLIQQLCEGDKKGFSAGKNSMDDLSHEELGNFIVDDAHKIIYCFIPKVACTNWKRVLAALKYSEPYPHPVSLEPGPVHDPEKFDLLNSCSKKERQRKIKDYTKFMFVREPLNRLISAYRDKFLPINQYYYEYFGRDILRKYGNVPNPPKTADKAFALGIRPSFNNFIQYLLDPKTEINEPFEPHWRQMYRLCHPCLIQYDFIGNQETLEEDAQELLKLLKLEDKIKFPPVYANTTSSDFVMQWFSSVPLEDRRKIYRLYREDFRLFGYRRPSELLDV